LFGVYFIMQVGTTNLIIFFIIFFFTCIFIYKRESTFWHAASWNDSTRWANRQYFLIWARRWTAFQPSKRTEPSRDSAIQFSNESTTTTSSIIRSTCSIGQYNYTVNYRLIYHVKLRFF
jgi:hypothetical protein